MLLPWVYIYRRLRCRFDFWAFAATNMSGRLPAGPVPIQRKRPRESDALRAMQRDIQQHTLKQPQPKVKLEPGAAEQNRDLQLPPNRIAHLAEHLREQQRASQLMNDMDVTNGERKLNAGLLETVGVVNSVAP